MNGRPTKYNSKYPELLIEHMSDGNSLTSFAARIGIARSTLFEWFKQFKEFEEAKEIGLSASESFWEDIGKSLARTNSSVYIFNMRVRFKWNDKLDNNENSKINTIIFVDENEMKL